MLDYLAIGVHELSSMSERRIERLVNPGNAIKEPFGKILNWFRLIIERNDELTDRETMRPTHGSSHYSVSRNFALGRLNQKER